MIAALVPVKRLGTGKSRLAAVLGGAAATRLAEAMLEDVLAALAATPGIALRAVVTPDPRAAAIAEASGARPLLGADPGLNPSLDRGARELGLGPTDGLLVLLGDVAGAEPSDLARMIAAIEELGGRGAVLAPTRDGGTGALLRIPWDAIPSRFGPASAAAHREAARRAGVALRELELPSLALDLDREDDLASFLARPGGGARTRALLAELGWKAPR